MGQIQILQRSLLPAGFDLFTQRVGEFPLFFDALKDGPFAFVQRRQVGVPREQGAERDFVEPSGLLFSVARDEGYRSALFEEPKRVLDLPRCYR